jgi:hypothetical protein
MNLLQNIYYRNKFLHYCELKLHKIKLYNLFFLLYILINETQKIIPIQSGC